MKQANKYWLLERGTREGNRLIFSRPWTPSSNTNIAATFRRVRENQTTDMTPNEFELNMITQWERDMRAHEFANNI